MTSITQIPIEDIELFIIKNGYDIPDNNKDSYNLARKLLRSAKYYPDIIIDWIIAHNVIVSDIKVPIYNKAEIYLLNDRKLDNLSKLLKLDRLNINSILNILNFIGKLKTETTIYHIMTPVIIEEIALNLPYNDIINNCNTSDEFNDLICNNNYFWKIKTNKDYPGLQLDGNWRRTYEKSLPKVYTFGSGLSGKLGYKTNDNVSIPKIIESLKNVTSVSCGFNHTAVIVNGKLYTFGDGRGGKLGHGNNNSLSTPKVIENLENVTFVSCGHSHTAVISNGKRGVTPSTGHLLFGKLYTFGNNSDGQLGHRDIKNIYIPKVIESLRNVTDVSCGFNHTAIIANGKLYTFGNAEYGQLGHGNRNSLAIPKIVKNLYNVTSVSCGLYYTAVIANNKLYTFGNSIKGQLGHGNNNNVYVPKIVESFRDMNVTSVSCGAYHTAVIENNKLYTFGNNFFGQLGDGGHNDSYFPKIIENLENVMSVSCGRDHTAVISNGKRGVTPSTGHLLFGKLYTFGRGIYGQLGNHDNHDSDVPEVVKELNNVISVSCGTLYTAAIAS